MSYFLSIVKKAMADKHLAPADIPRLSNGVVQQSVVSQILQGIKVPQKVKVVDALADALGIETMEFRTIVLLDKFASQSDDYGLQLSNVCSEAKHYDFFSVPVFRLEQLKSCLTPTGYPIPEKAVCVIRVAFPYGLFAYALEVPVTAMQPRVEPGEIIVVSQEQPLRRVDYGVVASTQRERVAVGKITDMGTYYQVEERFPYETYQITKNDTMYVHPIVDISVVPSDKRSGTIPPEQQRTEEEAQAEDQSEE